MLILKFMWPCEVNKWYRMKLNLPQFSEFHFNLIHRQMNKPQIAYILEL